MELDALPGNDKEENVTASHRQPDKMVIDQKTPAEQGECQTTMEATESGGIPGKPTVPRTPARTGIVSVEEQKAEDGSEDNRGHPHKTMEGMGGKEQESSALVGANPNTSEDVGSDEAVIKTGDRYEKVACDVPVSPMTSGMKPEGEPGDSPMEEVMKKSEASINKNVLSSDENPEHVNVIDEENNAAEEKGIPDAAHRNGDGTSDPVLRETTGDNVGKMSKIDSNQEESDHLDASCTGLRSESPDGKEMHQEASGVHDSGSREGTLRAGESTTEPTVTTNIGDTSKSDQLGEIVISQTSSSNMGDKSMEGELTAESNADRNDKGGDMPREEDVLIDEEKEVQKEDNEPATEMSDNVDLHMRGTEPTIKATLMTDIGEETTAAEIKELTPDIGAEKTASEGNGPENLKDAAGEGHDEKGDGKELEEGKDGEKEIGGAEEEVEDDHGDDEDDRKDGSPEGKKRMSRSSPIRSFDQSIFTVEKVFEYQWPQDHGEYFFVQEQISEYLAVTSFKRKYPALERRLIGVEERRFLKEKEVVTEEQVTLGLTALKSEEVYDVMQKDFPAKYSAYARLIQQRQREAIKNKHKEYGTPAIDEAKMKNYIKKAVRQAAEYNAHLMKQRREERGYYLDLQTRLVHCPKNKMKRLNKEQSKPGPYPVAVIPGQFQNYYKSYTPQELKYMPVNTAIYGPMATQKQSDIGPDLPPGSEVSSDEEDLSVSSEKPQKPEPKSTSKGTGSKPPSKSTPNKPASKNNSRPPEKESKPLAVIEPPFDHEKINPAFFKEQMQSVMLQPPRETPMMSLQLSPMVSNAPPPPVTQVLSQLLQQRGITQPKPPVYVPKEISDAICGLCLNSKESNRRGEPEELVHCSQCDNSGHPSCLEMSPELVCAIKTYPWQCMECKTCTLCGDPTHEDKMMFCDECDRGYHTFCVGLSDLPTGLWACASCRCVPQAQPLPPPSTETLPAMTPLTTAPVNGSPESTTAGITDVLKTPTNKNGTKRSAEPIMPKEELIGDQMKGKDSVQAPTPPPSKKRNTKKRQATPAKS